MARRIILRILLGVALATLVVMATSIAVAVAGEPEPRRSNLVVFTVVVVTPLFVIWCAYVAGTELASKLRKDTLPGQGLEVLVLKVKLRNRKWIARRYGRPPAAARILIHENGLNLTWADRTSSELSWNDAPQLTRRRVWAAYRRAQAVRVTSGDHFVEYVPCEAGVPLRGAAIETYFHSIVQLASG